MNVYPFIEAERVAGAGCVRRACLLLKVSRAAFYAWSSGALCERRLADDDLLERILAAHKASRGTYGAPRITRALRAADLRVGRKRVARLMARRGLAGRARRRTKRTTIADPAAKRQTADLLRRNFAPEAHEIDTLWCCDISSVRTWEGWLRSDSGFPSFLEPRSRSEQALAALLREAYVNRVSRRKVERLVEQLGLPGTSRSTVSRLSDGPDEQVCIVHGRPFGGRSPGLWLDAGTERVRKADGVRYKAMVVANGVHETIGARSRHQRRQVLECSAPRFTLQQPLVIPGD